MSIGLSSAELTQMRADIAQLLPDTCSIISYSNESDGSGGWSLSPSGTVTANCRLDFVSFKEVMSADSIIPFKTGYLSLPYDTAIDTNNQVVVDGVTYSVTGVTTGNSWECVRRATVERIP